VGIVQKVVFGVISPDSLSYNFESGLESHTLCFIDTYEIPAYAGMTIFCFLDSPKVVGLSAKHGKTNPTNNNSP